MNQATLQSPIPAGRQLEHAPGALPLDRQCLAGKRLKLGGVLLTAVVALGLALRAYHFLNNPPVWHDEANQICNVLDKDYGDFLGPLEHCEASPPLFLVVEKAVVGVLGDGTLALRLVPILASCFSYVALVLIARRFLPGPAVLWFGLLLGCSDRLLWHATEAKPYAVDVLVATGVLWLGLGLAGPVEPSTRRLGQLLVASAAIAPLLIFLSFPACFLLGGLALTALPMVWRRRCLATWLSYGFFSAMLGGSFLLLYATAIQAQRNDGLVAYWADNFPPWHQPWLVPLVTVVRLTELARYAAEPAGNALAILAIFGAAVLWDGAPPWGRHSCLPNPQVGRPRLVGLLAWPIGLNVLAWLLGGFPLGASRVVVYAAPAVLLLTAAGIPPALAWLRQRNRLAPLGLVAVLLVPAGQTAWVLIRPWQRFDSATPAAFVLEHRQANEPVLGTSWEQAYYFRQLGPFYRALPSAQLVPPSLPAAAALAGASAANPDLVDSFWLLSAQDPENQPNGTWQVVERVRFRDVVVSRVRR